MDYFKDVGGVKYTSAPELRRGADDSGFIGHRDQIQPTFNEFWNGLITNVDEIERRTNEAQSSRKSAAAVFAFILFGIFAYIYRLFCC